MTDDEILAIRTPAKEARQRHVEETNASLREKGLEIHPEIVELQRQYIEGEISLRDVMDYGLAIMRTIGHEVDPPPPTDFH